MALKSVPIKTFQVELERFVGKVLPERYLLAQQKIAIELLNRMIYATPRDTGRAQGAWDMGIIRPVAVDEYPDVKPPLNGALVDMSGLQLGGTIWIWNGVVYIIPLEHGHSKRAPAGMVDVSIASLTAELKAAGVLEDLLDDELEK